MNAALKSFLQHKGLVSWHFAVELVALELFNNAVLHGNGGDAAKSVLISLRVGHRWLRLQVEDDGGGFNWHRLSHQMPEPTAESGRGLAIARLYGQRLCFRAGGRLVEVWFDRCLPAAPRLL